MTQSDYVLVPRLLDEDMADALECEFSTEGQWKAALNARPSHCDDLLKRMEEMIVAGLDEATRHDRSTNGTCLCSLCCAAERYRALARLSEAREVKP